MSSLFSFHLPHPSSSAPPPVCSLPLPPLLRPVLTLPFAHPTPVLTTSAPRLPPPHVLPTHRTPLHLSSALRPSISTPHSLITRPHPHPPLTHHSPTRTHLPTSPLSTATPFLPFLHKHPPAIPPPQHSHTIRSTQTLIRPLVSLLCSIATTAYPLPTPLCTIHVKIALVHRVSG